MGFWDVGRLYGRPCKWQGTLLDTRAHGQSGLAAAGSTLTGQMFPANRRHRRPGIARQVHRMGRAHGHRDGRAGQLRRLRIRTAASACFESWIGAPGGWGGDRYHPGSRPGRPAVEPRCRWRPLRDRRELDAVGNQSGARGAPGRCRIPIQFERCPVTRTRPLCGSSLPSPLQMKQRPRTEP